jgi:hypothetical protein
MRAYLVIIVGFLCVSAVARAEKESLALVPLNTGVQGLDYGPLIASTLSARARVVENTQLKHLLQQGGYVLTQEIPPSRVETIEKLAKEGEELLYTDPKAAMFVLSRARREGASSSEPFMFDPALRSLMQKVNLLLAWAYLLTEQEDDATKVLKEAILLFGPDMPVTEREYHPKLVEFFKKVRDDLLQGSRCPLSISTDTDGCSFYLDGNPVTLEGGKVEVLCKTHYIRLVCNQREGLIHRVLASQNGEATSVSISMALDTALKIYDNSVSIMLENTEDIESFLASIAPLLGETTKTGLILFYGLFEGQQKKELRAWLVETTTSAIIASASVDVPADVISVSSATSLCDLLMPPTMEESEVSTRAVVPKKTPWFENYYGYAATAVGLGATIAGAVLFRSYLDHRSVAEDPNYKTNGGLGTWEEYQYKLSERDKAYSRRREAVACFATGGVAIVSSALLFVFTDKLMPARVTSDGRTVTLSLDF